MCPTAFGISCMYLLEPEEELKFESWENEKCDESKYRKKVDALSLRSAFEFKGNESRDPSTVPSLPSPKQKPNIVVVVGKQLQSSNFMLFFNNPIFLRKFPLIKLQRFWRTGQPKINNSSKYHSMARSISHFLFSEDFSGAFPISAVSQLSTLCARVLVKIPQPISGFWDLSCPTETTRK